MNTKNNIFIDIITSFKGTQQLNQAKTAFESLTGVVKGFAAAYSVEKVISDSIGAFKAEASAIAGLNVALKNTGTTFDALQPAFDKQVNSMTNLGFRSSDTLGALTKLTTSLGNPAKALDVLATTADLARYKNQDLGTTATQVAKAIAGNSRAFADLGLKIDKSLTPLNAFDKLISGAKDKAGGAATAYAKTLGGALDVAGAKAEAAKIKLGGALAPAITQVAQLATPFFSLISGHIAEITGMAFAILGVAAAIKAVGIASAIASGEMLLNPVFAVAAGIGLLGGALYANQRTPDTKFNPKKGTFTPPNLSGDKNYKPLSFTGTMVGVDLKSVPQVIVPKAQTAASILKTDQKKKELSADQILAQYEKDWAKQIAKDNANQIKASKDKLALDKAAKALKDAGKVLDLQSIEINAALLAGKNTLSEKDKDVLLLQQALLDQNSEAATNLAKALETAKTNNPLKVIGDDANTAKDAVNGLSKAMEDFGFKSAQAWRDYRAGERGDVGSYAGIPASTIPAAGAGGGAGGGTSKVEVTVTTSEDLKASIQQSFVNNTASGVPSTYNRNMDVAW